MAYKIVKKAVPVEIEVKKSRFLGFLRQIESKEQAMAFLNEIKQQHPSAIHHCWAFIVGDPNGSSLMGMSDDREPHGTAGKPMLSILQHKSVGDVVAAVVRYWGGSKLGTGGLVRAYSGAIQFALDKALLTEKIAVQTIAFAVDFAVEAAVRHCLEQHGLFPEDLKYTHQVEITLTVEIRHAEKLRSALTETVNGNIQFLNTR